MEKTKKEKSVFDGFTNLYELSKTLRFELKPVGNTQKMLDEADVFGKDRIIKLKYQNTKPFINRLHREFVDESLGRVLLTDFKKYFKVLENWKNNKKGKEVQKLLREEEERLRKEIVKSFNETAGNWAEKYSSLGLKKKDVEILFEEGVFEILKKRYGNEDGSFLKGKNGNFLKNEKGEKISIFDEWKGFTGYFTKFQQTRKNFYKFEGKAGQVATRIIDQNLKRFCNNLEDFKKIKNKIVDFIEVEKNFNKSIDEVFSLDFYNQCLLQNGIDTYNEILGGKTLDNGRKLRGVNELVNEYRQKNKGEKIPFLKLLDKQILSEKEKFVIGIENDAQLFETLKMFYKTAEEKTAIIKKLFFDFISNYKNYDLSKIYISKEALNTIAYKWASDSRKFEECIFRAIDKKEIRERYDSFRKDRNDPKIGKDENGYKFPNFIILQHIQDGLGKNEEEKFWKEKYYKNAENKKDKGFLIGKEPVFEQFLHIFDFEFKSLFESETVDKKGKAAKIGYSVFRKDFEKLIGQKNVSASPESKIIIKNFADNMLWIYQMAKYFAVEKKRSWNDEYELDDFYTNPDYGYKKFYENAYEEIVRVYNDLRNYLTKKPYSEEKWKLNFENPTLANGWDKNKESDNFAVILMKDGKYYLGLMKKGNNKIFDEKNSVLMKKSLQNGSYKKMVYKLFSDPKKDFPHICFSARGLDFFKPSGEIIKIYKSREFKRGKTFSVKSMQKLIRFYSDCLAKYEGWKCYNFAEVKKPENYNKNIGEFYHDVAISGYRISFQDISEDYIIQKNQNSEFYLFEIYNQDFAKGKIGVKNLHTLYFENLFSDENISKNFLIKLNGQAELFFRPKSIRAEKVKRKFSRKIINKKRYTEDKIFFHCPITLNREAGSIFRFNNYVNNFLSDKKDINIIGIDRGEKHLAYYSVIDQNGKKIKSGSFNTVGGIEYASKLEKKANERESARRDWQGVEDIKNMKKGYISQVVRELADLAIEHNAIIVLEDLNMRFKQIRGGIEKSIYQQLERALIDKLSFLVNKNEKDPKRAGHPLKAYQLAAPFESFRDMGKQTGIVFYTQASYTSKTCPRCGFRKNNNKFYFEGNIEKAKNVLSRVKSFEYDEKNKCFNLSYCLSDFVGKGEIEKNKSKRGNILFSKVDKKDLFKLTTKDAIRYKWHDKSTERGRSFSFGEDEYIDKVVKEEKDTKKGIVKKYDLTKCLIGLFESDDAKKSGLDYKNNLLEKLISEKFNSNFYKRLFGYLNLIFEIRNSISSTEVDYISCPECGFHSDKSSNIENGDDNGAYNIARKGIMILEKIKQYKKNNGSLNGMNWGDLFIDIEEWDKFTQIVNKNF